MGGPLFRSCCRRVQHRDAVGLRLLLRVCAPDCHCEQQTADNLAPPHSITSSAAMRSVGGTLMPSAFAVFKLIESVNFVG